MEDAEGEPFAADYLVDTDTATDTSEAREGLSGLAGLEGLLDGFNEANYHGDQRPIEGGPDMNFFQNGIW